MVYIHIKHRQIKILVLFLYLNFGGERYITLPDPRKDTNTGLRVTLIVTKNIRAYLV